MNGTVANEVVDDRTEQHLDTLPTLKLPGLTLVPGKTSGDELRLTLNHDLLRAQAVDRFEEALAA